MSDNANSGNGGTGETGETQAFGVPDAVAGASGDGNAHDPGRMQRVLDTHYGAGRFRTGKVIGRGGMSTVWLAYDTAEQRDVAVKVLKPELTDDPEFRARFRAEAEAAETIRSEHVVATYDYGEQANVDGTGMTYCFIVMEYIQGESLADILSRERTLPEVMALDLVTQAALGLQAIHERRLVHRDIKPGNLMVTADGVVKVTDFGIAKAASAVPLTRTGMVVGTAQYVSPEQAQGHDVGPSSDVYSLGVVGYEMLAGRRPFAGESTVSVALKHISAPVPEIPGEVSAPMRRLISVCLRKNPAARYADGAELAAATVPVHDGQMPPEPRSGVAPATDPRNPRVPQTQLAPGTTVAPAVAGAAAAGSGRLGRVTDRSNMGPAPRDRRRDSAQQSRQGQQGRPAPKKSGSPALWAWAGGLILVAALAVVVWMLVSGGHDGGSSPATETHTVTNDVPVQQDPGYGSTPGNGSGTGTGGADTPTSPDEGTGEESPTPTTPPETSPEPSPSPNPSPKPSPSPNPLPDPSDIGGALDDLLGGNGNTAMPDPTGGTGHGTGGATTTDKEA